jgi:hypothetical protein
MQPQLRAGERFANSSSVPVRPAARKTSAASNMRALRSFMLSVTTISAPPSAAAHMAQEAG